MTKVYLSGFLLFYILLPDVCGFFHSKLSATSGYRLPGTAVPKFYNLTITVDLIDDVRTAIKGNVVINLDVHENNPTSNSLELNSHFINYTTPAKWTLENGTSFECQIKISPSPKENHIEIICPHSIIGKNQSVEIQYFPTVYNEDMEGAYLVRYEEEDEDKFMIATQFEIDGARRVFPCFDEPNYKAPVQLTLKSHIELYNLTQWIGNTKVQSSFYDENSIPVTIFEATPPISSYLIAFVVTKDFKNFTATSYHSSDYEFNVFVRKSADGFVGVAQYYGPILIDTLSSLLGINYSSLGIPKMTLAAIPEFSAGAMENWGLITYRETYLIDEGNLTNIKALQQITEVIAHELTHQWFGDFVTLNWWSNIWLNEGFANFFELYASDKVLVGAEMLDQLLIKDQQPAFKYDAYSELTFPLSNNASKVTTPEEMHAEFGTISYSKGASIIKMIKDILGDELFLQTLNVYLNDNKYSNPTSENLIEHFDIVSEENLNEYLHNWVFESGYPILQVSLANNSTISINATKFTADYDSNEDATSNWWLPITYTTSDVKNFNISKIHWIHSSNLSTEFKLEVNSSETWAVFNLQASGFYRVNYDTTLWSNIIAALSSSHNSIHKLNRAQLLDDIFEVAKYHNGSEREQIDAYKNAFELIDYLKNETEFQPWHTFFVEIEPIINNKDIDNETHEAIIQKVSDIITAPAVQRIPGNSNDTKNLTHVEILTTDLLLWYACLFKNRECIEWSTKEFERYKITSNSIDTNYRDVILCNGLAHSETPEKDFQFLLKMYENSNLPWEKTDLILALACYEGPEFFENRKEVLRNELRNINGQSFEWILARVNSQENNIEMIKYLIENVLKINNSEEVTKFLELLSRKCYTHECVEILTNFLQNEYSRPSPIYHGLKNALKIIKNNIKWAKKKNYILKSAVLSK